MPSYLQIHVLQLNQFLNTGGGYGGGRGNGRVGGRNYGSGRGRMGGRGRANQV